MGTKFSQISEETKQALGLVPSWQTIHILPWKMKIIAQATLNGTPFTEHIWKGRGEGKLLVEDEWETLIADLHKLGCLSNKNKWTKTGKKMLRICVSSSLL